MYFTQKSNVFSKKTLQSYTFFAKVCNFYHEKIVNGNCGESFSLFLSMQI